MSSFAPRKNALSRSERRLFSRVTCAPSRRFSAAGLTLLEMLLVLAVLAAALAVLYPATERLYQTYRFQQALDQVQTKLAATRVRAIDEGVVYQFRFEPEGRRLLILPRGQVAVSKQAVEKTAGPALQAPGRWRYAGELPGGMRFGAADRGGERISSQRLTDFPQGAELATANWSAPVLFFPDGSATDARIPVLGGSGRETCIAIRGLTGAASVR